MVIGILECKEDRDEDKELIADLENKRHGVGSAVLAPS